MVCVICLDEEVPCELTPCRVCFSTKFHTECFENYRRTRNVCPTCKGAYEPLPTPELAPTLTIDPIDNEEEPRRRIQNSDVYHTCMVVQFLVLIFTLAFTPRKDKFEFWTLFLTVLFLTSMHMFERVQSACIFFTICAGITTSCTVINTILFNHNPLYISYACMTCFNRGVYTTWMLCHPPHQIHPVQSNDA